MCMRPGNRRRWLALALVPLGAIVAATQAAAQAPDGGWTALEPAGVVLFRHAQAPGVGDPPSFRLGDCATQRNLSAEGRAQARRLGERFRERGVQVGAVRSSQWCRTRETAELAFPGQVQDAPAFNSFFGDSGSAPRQTAAALAELAAWRGPGVLVVVTHQVNITALTGVYPASGEGVVVRRKAGAAAGVEVVGRVAP
jgi:phosphohistidine phosphatase SixA